ncbi:MAG: DUF58 domain-containing protein [Actinobacteria bacterium]|nr:DUF58 domain-containing protein [Actinomycetota bacterium]
MRVYLRPRLVLVVLGGGVAAALAGGGSWVVAAVLDGFAVALLVVDVALAPRPGLLRVEDETPSVLTVGEVGEVLLEARNPLGRPLDLEVRDATPPSLRRDPARHRGRIEAGGSATLRSEIRPTRRGRFRLGPLTVRAGGPLGLGGRQWSVDRRRPVHVYPALPGRAEADLRLERARVLQSGERSSRIRGGGTEFDSLREYHPDDEFRRINWRATARSVRPVTNVFREERNQRVLLLFDVGRTMAGTVGGVARFEHALDAGFAVAELAARIGDHVGMAAFDGSVRVAVGPRSGRGQLGRVLGALFDLEPSLEAPNYGLAVAEVLARYRRRALLVLLTDLGSEATLEPLLDALPALRARHIVLFGSVADPSVAEAATAIPSSAEEVYRKAAAAGSVAARNRAAARLRSVGVDVVDRPPGRLAGALADRYLRMKAYGRL